MDPVKGHLIFPGNSISLIVSASRTDFKVLKDLNPEIRYLTEGAYTILIPKGSKRGFIRSIKI